jgi:hypothetical protein
MFSLVAQGTGESSIGQSLKAFKVRRGWSRKAILELIWEKKDLPVHCSTVDGNRNRGELIDAYEFFDNDQRQQGLLVVQSCIALQLHAVNKDRLWRGIVLHKNWPRPSFFDHLVSDFSQKHQYPTNFERLWVSQRNKTRQRQPKTGG